MGWSPFVDSYSINPEQVGTRQRADLFTHCHSSRISNVGRRGSAPAAINLSARIVSLSGVNVADCILAIGDYILQISYHFSLICSIIGS